MRVRRICNTHFQRRRANCLRWLATGLLPVLAAWPGLPARAAAPLTVVSWGGAYTRSQILGFIRPYEKQHHVTVSVLDYGGGLEQIRAQVRSYNVKWDVVDLELADAIRGCREGLLVKIDPARLAPAPDGSPTADDFIPGSLRPCAVGSVTWSTVIAYNPAAYGEHAPDRLKDFFDVKRFPGRRGMRNTPKANLEWALMADGVAPSGVYRVLGTEAGIERAFRVLDRIKPYIEWWDSGEQAVRMLETGRVAMTTVYNGRIYAASQRNEHFPIIWDHQIWNLDLWGIPRHTGRLKQAMDFIRFATSPSSLAAQARYIPYGPVRRSAMARVNAKMRPHLPTADKRMDNALQINAQWWADHYQTLQQRFEQWRRRPVMVPRALPR
ncbi:MAG: ABC transporter substrate-binding protein [Gammaproteobacteria bacterium]